MNEKVLALVMAGGEGSRLHPLTAERSKPSVPFGGRYRIVDFVLSNLINSEINSIYLLVQYKSQSLIEHVRQSWVLSPMLPAQFVTIVPPQMLAGEEWFQGTADAVRQNLNLIYQHKPDLVAVFGADHIYRMDLRQMVAFHLAHDCDVSVAALPVPIEQASAFGVITADAEGKIAEFLEKPESPPPMPGDPRRVYASMGNYLFRTGTLVKALESDLTQHETDFGRHVLPRLIGDHKVYAYNFGQNKVPGAKAYEEANYWRDVGTIEAYFDAHQDVLGREPRFDVLNRQWPIYSSSYQGPVAKVMSGNICNSILGGGALICGASVKDTILRREVTLEDDVELDQCIIMDYARIERGCKLRRVIVDRYNVIKAGTTIGYDEAADRERYHVSDSGIVVIGRGKRGLDRRYAL
ncbi:MAG: glucose-1-phosphate adenylyltransferase [Burkholderiales bacterium]|nr:glucose-1-phosphate adenylyltransferase [Burkholderiales bacterium]